MGDKSAIEWTEATWNPVTGCTKVSPGCAHCYAESLSLRFGWSRKPWTPENEGGNVLLHPERLDQPLRWRRPRVVFVNSMSDLFHERVPFEFAVRVFEVMREAGHHTFQVLTKRPERMKDYWCRYLALVPQVSLREQVPIAFSPQSALPNVWLGVSIENTRFTWRADVLRSIPAAVRFISAEPLLGSLLEPGGGARASQVRRVAKGNAASLPSLRKPLDLAAIDWLIAGGESGRHARPVRVEWVRELRDACAEASVAFFFKQWGGRTAKVGGRILDGREWSQMPLVPTAA